MQIIVPMSGFGERFKKAGYKIPKPLIEVEGKPIIHHVIDMFPGEHKFIFICNEDHLNNDSYNMKNILLDYCPTAVVLAIKKHKLGPVHAVLQATHLIDLKDEIVINYCDFSCYWNWQEFKSFVNTKKNLLGAIPAYKGFHPHSLGTTNYAYIRESNLIVSDIQEKKPFTENRMNEYASSGTYYFKTGSLMLEALKFVIEKDLKTGDEFYISLAFKFFLESRKLVCVYPIQHFMQWGTPEDLSEFEQWSSIFKKIMNLSNKEIPNSVKVIPMAGLGQRFADEGYKKVKPLINVSGKPMVFQSVDSLPEASKNIFVIRSDMKDANFISKELRKAYANCEIVELSSVTEGQACTAQFGIQHLDDYDGPIVIGACDNGAIYNSEKLDLILRSDYDLIVWGVKGYTNAIRNPNQFGWLKLDHQDNIEFVSVKEQIDNLINDPIVLGTFIFKNVKVFNQVINSLFSRNGKVNNEYYLDSCINDAIEMNLKVKYFEVEHFLCWGTPNDLKTFEYWQSCFSKWASHPYVLESDCMIPFLNIKDLQQKYEKFVF